MLRVNLAYEETQVTLKLEGSLKGPWVSEVEHSWLAVALAAPAKSVRVTSRTLALSMPKAGF